ncbi:MAG: ribonuclease P protein component [Betaproteobacteria bacterium]|nr:ribonuclease P protein component [Betaproteobacteria bacterium]
MRLRRREEFEAALRHGRVENGVLFVMRALARAPSPARLGIIAGRRAIQRAVDRNQCKRLVRAEFRAWVPRLAGLDVVVLCKHPISRTHRKAARQELARLFGRIAGFGEAPAAIKRGRPAGSNDR